MKNPIYVLDSFAILAYFQAETGGIKVKDILKQAKKGDVSTSLSLINLGEVFYITGRKLSSEKANDMLRDILLLPIQLAELTIDRVLAAAQIKAQYPISYADAFVVALARELNATILTGDSEFKQVEPIVKILWL